ncbi:MAG: hypothetical protein LBO74_11935 [Candidatus Symbiothrix sp.]|jgi:hypothetical protein|nr:hypothetical protein [Candidatus Symbiothrix sp.]
MRKQNLLRKKLSGRLMSLLVVAYVALGSINVWGQTTIAQWNGYTYGAPPADGIFLATEGSVSNKGIAVLTRDVSGTGYVVNSDGMAASTAFHNALTIEKYWITTFSTKDYKDLTVTSRQMGSDAGPKDFKIQYWADAGWMDLAGGTITVGKDNYLLGVKTNLELPAELNNKESVSLRWLCTSTDRIDESGAVDFRGVNRLEVIIKGVDLADEPQPVTTYTVTFNAGTGSCSTSSLTEESNDSGILLPVAVPCNGSWEFAGWSENEITETTIAPTLIPTGIYKPKNNSALYAVYKKTTAVGTASLTSTELREWNTALSYSDAEKTLTNAGGAWTFKGYRENKTCGYVQIRKDTVPSYIKLPDLAGNIIQVDLECTNSGGNNFAGIIFLKNGIDGETLASQSVNGKTSSLLVSKACTTGYITVTGNVCRINYVAITYSSATTTYNSNPGCFSTQTIWTGASLDAPTDWKDTSNWSDGIPGEITGVTIPKSDFYPIVPENTAINSITFEAGAEIGNPHLLDYQHAKVELDLKAGRWHLLSMPLAVKSGDFYFDGNPNSWIRTFTTTGNQAGWKYITNLEESFDTGDGFAFWVGADTEFTIEGSSLAGASVSKTLKFGEDENLESFFALAGNPFMTSIDFEKLVSKNNAEITPSYLIWTGQGFSGYNTNGSFGTIADGLNKYIAPLQSFIVEKSNAGEISLDFNLTDIQATNCGNGLKVSEKISNKLDIVASNETASVRTFIARREAGQSSRKLMAEVSEVPDIYTLNETTALGAQLIYTDDALIPIGLSTSYSGNMSFTFNGMDDYDAKIVFRDLEKGKEIDMTGLSRYEYSFEYIPKKINDRIVAEENRFFVQIQPVQTGWNTPVLQEVNVYSQNKTIRVVSGFDNPIRQIKVYNTQGALVYADENVHTSSYTIHRNGYIPEVCIVKVITGQGIKNVRIFVK